MKAVFNGKYVTVTMTRAQAEQIGILKCANCGYPKNNHFSWRPYPSAFLNSCLAFKPSIILPKVKTNESH